MTTLTPFDEVSCTDQVTTAWAGAVAAAVQLNHGYVGTEHLLLGLTQQAAGSAHQVFQSLDLTHAQVWTGVESRVGRGFQPPRRLPPATPRVARVVSLAWSQAQRRGDACLRTAHLLLGLQEEPENVAIWTLQELGVTLPILQQQTEEALEEEIQSGT